MKKLMPLQERDEFKAKGLACGSVRMAWVFLTPGFYVLALPPEAVKPHTHVVHRA